MSMLGWLSRRLSSAEVDSLDLCIHSVRSIEDIVKWGNLLNQRQCLDLSSKLSKTTLNIGELVLCCRTSVVPFRLVLQILYGCLEKARFLVNECADEDWCAAAVTQSQNENAFREILLEVSLCYNAIYEQAKSIIGDSHVLPEDLRESFVFRPAKESDIHKDLQDLQKWLEDLALDQSLERRGDIKQCLARYLLGKLKCTSGKSQVNTSDICSAILWAKETEPPGTWGNSRFLGSGTGASGVLSTTWLGIPCAKKQFHSQESERFFLKEAGILACLKHPCIVNFFCCGDGHEAGDRFIAMELMEKSLFDLIKEQKTEYFSLPVVIDIVVQIARGMRYLHGQGVAHRDLQPQNVVVSRVTSPRLWTHFYVKLVDFGMSTTTLEMPTPNTKNSFLFDVGTGTTLYRAPKPYHNADLGGQGRVIGGKGKVIGGKGMVNYFKADVFSFSMTCVHLLSLKRPFGNVLLDGRRPELPSQYPEELVGIVRDCWNRNPRSRPSFVEICRRLEMFRYTTMLGLSIVDKGFREKRRYFDRGFNFASKVIEEHSFIQGTSFDMAGEQLEASGAGGPTVLSYGDDQGYGGEDDRNAPFPTQYGNSYGASSSMFPPNSDRSIIQVFQQAEVGRSGTIDESELGRLLSEGRITFSPHTICLMLYLFADNPADPTRIGPTGFVNLWRELGLWHEKFMEYDRDGSGTIDVQDLENVLGSFHFAIPLTVLEMLVKKYDHSGYNRSIDYGQFIECGFIVKGLTEKFREQDKAGNGTATFDYTSFMLTVTPFIPAIDHFVANADGALHQQLPQLDGIENLISTTMTLLGVQQNPTEAKYGSSDLFHGIRGHADGILGGRFDIELMEIQILFSSLESMVAVTGVGLKLEPNQVVLVTLSARDSSHVIMTVLQKEECEELSPLGGCFYLIHFDADINEDQDRIVERPQYSPPTSSESVSTVASDMDFEEYKSFEATEEDPSTCAAYRVHTFAKLILLLRCREASDASFWSKVRDFLLVWDWRDVKLALNDPGEKRENICNYSSEQVNKRGDDGGDNGSRDFGRASNSCWRNSRKDNAKCNQNGALDRGDGMGEGGEGDGGEDNDGHNHGRQKLSSSSSSQKDKNYSIEVHPGYGCYQEDCNDTTWPYKSIHVYATPVITISFQNCSNRDSKEVHVKLEVNFDLANDSDPGASDLEQNRFAWYHDSFEFSIQCIHDGAAELKVSSGNVHNLEAVKSTVTNTTTKNSKSASNVFSTELKTTALLPVQNTTKVSFIKAGPTSTWAVGETREGLNTGRETAQGFLAREKYEGGPTPRIGCIFRYAKSKDIESYIQGADGRFPDMERYLDEHICSSQAQVIEGAFRPLAEDKHYYPYLFNCERRIIGFFWVGNTGKTSGFFKLKRNVSCRSDGTSLKNYKLCKKVICEQMFDVPLYINHAMNHIYRLAMECPDGIPILRGGEKHRKVLAAGHLKDKNSQSEIDFCRNR